MLGASILFGARPAPTALFPLLGGRSGGQTIKGGTGSGEHLTLMSTNHATKGKIKFGTSAYDEANNNLGISTDTPQGSLDILKASVADFYLRETNTTVSRMVATGGQVYWQIGTAIESGSAAPLNFTSIFAASTWARILSDGRWVFTVPNSALADESLSNSQATAYLNQAGNLLIFKVKYSDGTVKTVSLALL